MEYLTNTVLELMKRFDVRIETKYIDDLNMLEVYIEDKETGKNKIVIYGSDCYDEAVRLGKPQIEIAMCKLYEYLKNMYDKKEPEVKIVANFSCPNCGAPDLGNNEYRFDCCENCGQKLDWEE